MWNFCAISCKCPQNFCSDFPTTPLPMLKGIRKGGKGNHRTPGESLLTQSNMAKEESQKHLQWCVRTAPNVTRDAGGIDTQHPCAELPSVPMNNVVLATTIPWTSEGVPTFPPVTTILSGLASTFLEWRPKWALKAETLAEANYGALCTDGLSSVAVL